MATIRLRLVYCSGPSKECGGHALSARRHRRKDHLSWDARRSRVFICNGVASDWVTGSRSGVLGFPFAPAVFLPLPSPVAFATGSSSRTLSFPPEFLVRQPARQNRAPSLGFHALIAAAISGVHNRGRPRPAPFRPRRLPPPLTFAGLFHPAATSRVRSPGVSPREKPHGLVARRCPHAVCAVSLPPV